MKIIKEVKLSVSSEITNLSPSGAPEGEAEFSKEEASGFLHFSDNEIMLSYITSGDGGEVETDIVISGRKIRVVRRGAVSSDFLFEEGEMHKSLYSVGKYSFEASVAARKIRCSVTEFGGRADLYYHMNIGGADKDVKMKIIAEQI